MDDGGPYGDLQAGGVPIEDAGLAASSASSPAGNSVAIRTGVSQGVQSYRWRSDIHPPNGPRREGARVSAKGGRSRSRPECSAPEAKWEGKPEAKLPRTAEPPGGRGGRGDGARGGGESRRSGGRGGGGMEEEERGGRGGGGGEEEGRCPAVAVAVASAVASSSARETLLAAVPQRPTWEAVLSSALQGMHGPPLTAEQLDRAVVDYWGTGTSRRGKSRASGTSAPICRTSDGRREVQRRNDIPVRGAAMFGKIRELARSQGGSRFIPRDSVAELGAESGGLSAGWRRRGIPGLPPDKPSTWSVISHKL